MSSPSRVAEKKTRRPLVGFVKASLSDQAYEEIKRQILDQVLKAGERLNVDALARECGISSSPLREALFKLQGEGLVSAVPNSGFYVTPVPDAIQLQQMLEFRWMIERHCARIGAAACDEETISKMKRAIDAMHAMREKGVSYRQYRAYAEADRNFHMALVASARNDIVMNAYRNLDAVLLVARLTVMPNSNSIGSAEGMAEHLQILAAFEAGDFFAVDAAIEKHSAGSKQRMRALNTNASLTSVVA